MQIKWAYWCLSLAALGCEGGAASSQLSPPKHPLPTASSPPVPPDAPAHPAPYPRGQWRTGSRAELDHTVLWLSHVLIRHVDVEQEQMSFNVTGWKSAQPYATRARREALALAETVVARARTGTAFAELAREFSEDPATRERGGSLGGIVAGHLLIWPQVLDAVEALKPGEVSNVIETEFGYHVLSRREPPPESSVSGAHIVIAHDDAPWLELTAGRAMPQRSREEALALARGVYEKARAAPGAFAALVREYSEHRDAARGGDFGSWSTREPTGYSREIETLSGLEVGAIAEPIDTFLGYQIIQRTAEHPRQRYAASEIVLPFDSRRPDEHPESRAAAAQRARDILRELTLAPARFEALQESLCCPGVSAVVEGRRSPGLETALSRLAIGEVAGEPIDDAVEFTIVKRLPLNALPAQPVTNVAFGGTSDSAH